MLTVMGVLLSCSAPSHEQPTTRFVVVPASGAPEIAKGGTWQLTKEDIAGLEANLFQVSALRPENRQAVGDVRIGSPRTVLPSVYCGHAEREEADLRERVL